MVLVAANKTGVQNSNMRLSKNVFKMTSMPIPFKSPIDIPTIILDFYLP
jgi:hypothetical protein